MTSSNLSKILRSGEEDLASSTTDSNVLRSRSHQRPRALSALHSHTASKKAPQADTNKKKTAPATKIAAPNASKGQRNSHQTTTPIDTSKSTTATKRTAALGRAPALETPLELQPTNVEASKGTGSNTFFPQPDPCAFGDRTPYDSGPCRQFHVFGGPEDCEYPNNHRGAPTSYFNPQTRKGWPPWKRKP